MKAVQFSVYGKPDVLHITDVSTPEVKTGMVLIEVSAASINVFDLKLMSGAYQKMVPLTLPITIGGDFAGVVKTVDEGVTTIKVGDEVYGSALVLSGGSEAMAEYATAKGEQLALQRHLQ